MQYRTVGRTGVQVSSRRWLVTELDNSLRRVNADHINSEIAGRRFFL
jgi:hypothetical protein